MSHVDPEPPVTEARRSGAAGEMTVAQFEEWLDTHPPLPQTGHSFMEPCGQMEGRNSCWYCGKPRSWHPSSDEDQER